VRGLHISAGRFVVVMTGDPAHARPAEEPGRERDLRDGKVVGLV
jgi:hypothetical protein